MGWLSTPEESFSGFLEENSTKGADAPYIGAVKDILDSVYE
jgi:lysosomal alpha-mannosidase